MPLPVSNPVTLRQKVDEYFDKCDKDRQFPDYDGMINYIYGCVPDVDELVKAMIDPSQNPKAADCKAVLDWACRRRRSTLTRRMVTDNKAAAGCKSALSLPENGGFITKTESNTDRRVKVEMNEDTEELFK